jgi:phage repressor protein C with HTH and peptisase S24 domain
MLFRPHVSMLAMATYRLLGDNIAYLVAIKVASRGSLAEAMGTSVQAVGQLIRGETKELKPSNLAKAARHVGLTSDDLITRNLRLEQWHPDNHLRATGTREDAPEYRVKREAPALIYFPVLSIAGSGGPGTEGDGALEVIDEIAFKRTWIRKKGWEPKQLFVHHVKGDSMADWMPDGNIALVHRGDLIVREHPGGPYENVFALQDGSAYRFKQIVPQEDGSLILHSFNQARDDRNKLLYPDERRAWDELESLHIIGRVVWRGG